MNYLNAFLLIFLFVTGAKFLSAQETSYNTDDLKKRKKISTADWNALIERSLAEQKKYMDAVNGESSYLSTVKGTLLKTNQTVTFIDYVAVFSESMRSRGQGVLKPSGQIAITPRAVYLFKIGPGKYEIKDGIIKRVE